MNGCCWRLFSSPMSFSLILIFSKSNLNSTILLIPMENNFYNIKGDNVSCWTAQEGNCYPKASGCSFSSALTAHSSSSSIFPSEVSSSSGFAAGEPLEFPHLRTSLAVWRRKVCDFCFCCCCEDEEYCSGQVFLIYFLLSWKKAVNF